MIQSVNPILKNLHIMAAARSCTASVGASQEGQNGLRRYCANVKAVIAFPVGTRISNATQR